MKKIDIYKNKFSDIYLMYFNENIYKFTRYSKYHKASQFPTTFSLEDFNNYDLKNYVYIDSHTIEDDSINLVQLTDDYRFLRFNDDKLYQYQLVVDNKLLFALTLKEVSYFYIDGNDLKCKNKNGSFLVFDVKLKSYFENYLYEKFIKEI